MLDQKITTGNESSLFSTQINSLALQRNQREEAGATRDTALNERIESLEQKIQSILQENTKIETELNEARDLYQQRKEYNELSKKKLLGEIAPLEERVTQLNTTIENKSKANLELSRKITKEIASRDHWRTHWTKIMRALGMIKK